MHNSIASGAIFETEIWKKLVDTVKRENKIFHFNQPQLIISSDLETVKFLDKKDLNFYFV